MDASLLHLTVHHFPIVLSVAGAIAALAGLFSRGSTLSYFAAVSLALAGMAAPAAYFSGRLAASELLTAGTASSTSSAAVRAAVEPHALYGLLASLVLLAAGVIAGVWLLRGDRHQRVLLLVAGLAAAGASAAAGWTGGLIRH